MDRLTVDHLLASPLPVSWDHLGHADPHPDLLLAADAPAGRGHGLDDPLDSLADEALLPALRRLVRRLGVAGAVALVEGQPVLVHDASAAAVQVARGGADKG